jgi:hypothetical protein
MYDTHAALRDLTRPRSSGTVQNKHAVRASRTAQPDYEKMRQMTHPDEGRGGKKD